MMWRSLRLHLTCCVCLCCTRVETHHTWTPTAPPTAPPAQRRRQRRRSLSSATWTSSSSRWSSASSSTGSWAARSPSPSPSSRSWTRRECTHTHTQWNTHLGVCLPFEKQTFLGSTAADVQGRHSSSSSSPPLFECHTGHSVMNTLRVQTSPSYLTVPKGSAAAALWPTI